MARIRYTDDEKARLLGEFGACGGSAAAFCRERELPYQSFLSWQRRAAGAGPDPKGTPAPEFVEFDLGGKSCAGAADGPRVELDLGGGITLRIHLPVRQP